MSDIRVLLVDDEELVRDGLGMLLTAATGIAVVGAAASGEEALRLADELLPDVVVMDIRMPGLDGVATTRRLAEMAASSAGVVHVLILSSFHDDDLVFGALRAGATGYLLKSAVGRDLSEAIRRVADGAAWLDPVVARRLIADVAAHPDVAAASQVKWGLLTNREREVLVLLARGLGTADISRHLVISEATTKTHISRILMKTGLRDRTQAVAAAYRAGLVPS